MRRLNAIAWLSVASAIALISGYFVVRSPAYYEEIHVALGQDKELLVPIQIGDEVIPVEVNLSSRVQLFVDAEVLRKVELTPAGRSSWRDHSGAHYDSPSYYVNEVKFGNLPLKGIIATPEVHDGETGEAIAGSASAFREKAGSLGYPFLEHTNLLLDCGKGKVVATNSTRRLRKAGYDLRKMVRLPLGDPSRVVFTLGCDLGERRFALNTGGKVSVMKANLLEAGDCERVICGLPATVRRWSGQGQDVGKVAVARADLHPDYPADGILGMDFLVRRVVYIDYQDRCVYIGGRP